MPENNTGNVDKYGFASFGCIGIVPVSTTKIYIIKCVYMYKPFKLNSMMNVVMENTV